MGADRLFNNAASLVVVQVKKLQAGPDADNDSTQAMVDL